MKRLFLGLCVAGVSAAIVVASVAYLTVRPALQPADPAGEEVLFRVERGQAMGAIARRLADEGLVRDARVLRGLARWRGVDGKLHVGEYRLSAAMTPDEILAHLTTGRVATWEVVVPEGFTAAQIGERLAAEGLADAEAFDRAVRDAELIAKLGIEGETLEGYLYPETYRFPRGLPADQIAAAFVDEFLNVWREIEPRAKERELSMREVVTLASIVEKETGAPQERPLIASVFGNRLKRGMRLESDPTTIYGIPNFDGNLRRRDLENGDNPYNTYRISGLPPGPIANPGADALRAVVEPAESDYLFFVSKNDGTHTFSKTYAEHVQAVNCYQKRGCR